MGRVEYEDLTLANERIQFSISSEEMKCLNLKFGTSKLDKKGYDELLALAVSFHDYQGLDPDDLVWAKITVIVQIILNFYRVILYLSERKEKSECSEDSRKLPPGLHVKDWYSVIHMLVGRIATDGSICLRECGLATEINIYGALLVLSLAGVERNYVNVGEFEGHRHCSTTACLGTYPLEPGHDARAAVDHVVKQADGKPGHN
uniref:Uncharacterized protein n=1 Tax=Aegilops tauschii TaxID=37682 RepID=M8BL04_AEGTA